MRVAYLLIDNGDIRKHTRDFLNQLMRFDRIERGDILEAQDSQGACEIISGMFYFSEKENAQSMTDMCFVISDASFVRELLELMKKQGIGKESVFFLVSYSSITPELFMICVEEGISSFLQKPFSQNDFQKCISGLVEYSSGIERKLLGVLEDMIERGEFYSAIEFISKHEKLLPASKKFILEGRAYMGLEKLKEAELCFRAARRMGGATEIISLKKLVEIFQVKGDVFGAVEVLEELTQKLPNDPDQKISLSDVLIATSQTSKAKTILDDLAKRRRLELKKQMRVAELLEKGGFSDEAAALRVRISEDSNDSYFCNENAIALRRGGRYEDADRCYEILLRNSPDNHIFILNRAFNFWAWGMVEKNKKLLNQALEMARRAKHLGGRDEIFMKKAEDAIERINSALKSSDLTTGQ